MPQLRAPAEEAPYTRTWMCWPAHREDYEHDGRQSGYFEEVQATIGRLAAAIAEYEPVVMCACPDHSEAATAACGDRVEIAPIPTDDMWARDTGPVFVASPGPNPAGEKAGVNFNFNAWGGKAVSPVDASLAERILDYAGVREITASITGEGGGVEYDGEGTLLLIESCWVNEKRNPGRSRDEIKRELRRALGVEQVIWLKGVAGLEETDGHIDGYVRFIRPGLVLMSSPGRNHERFYGETLCDDDYVDARERLRRARDAAGRRFEIVELPWARTARSNDPRFFASYANFYVGNGAVYPPHFGDVEADERAEAVFADLLPGRDVVMLDVDRIYENGGGIHCVTQQEPA